MLATLKVDGDKVYKDEMKNTESGLSVPYFSMLGKYGSVQRAIVSDIRNNCSNLILFTMFNRYTDSPDQVILLALV
jgi:hypothetical protein